MYGWRISQVFCQGGGLSAINHVSNRINSAAPCSCWDPKDGELCLNRVKPEETLVEARSGSDVQIDRQIWA